MKKPGWLRVDTDWISSLVNNLTANAIWALGGAIVFAVLTMLDNLPYSVVVLAAFCGAVAALYLAAWIKKWLARRSRSEAANQEAHLARRPWASEDELNKSPICDRTFFIFDVPRDDVFNNSISHRVFERCTILGPAIIVFEQCILKETFFSHEDGIDGIIWPKTNSLQFVGAVFLRGCTLQGCRTRWIGIAGTEEQSGVFREKISQNPK